MIRLDIQMFADAGTNVNTTTGYVNAYTGITGVDANNVMTPGMKTFYDTAMLDNARDALVYAQLGKDQPLPANSGKKVEWRKWNTLPDADELVEGVIPEGKKFGQTVIDVEITQHGLYVPITDVLEKHHVDPVWLGATEEVGASIGRTHEKVIRKALMMATNVLLADAVKTDDGSYSYVSTPTDRGALSTAVATFNVLTPDMIAQAVTALQKANAPYYDGAEYLGVLNPSVWYDLRKNPFWVDVHKYSQTTEIFNGEVGELHGVRFLKSNMAPIIRGGNLQGTTRNLAVYDTTTDTATVNIKGTVTIAEGDLILPGTKVVIGGVTNEVVTFTGHADANSAVMVLKDKITAAANDVIYPEGGVTGQAVYQTMIFGKEAFGVIKPDGASIETIIHEKTSGIGGPLNQFGTVGGKFSGAAKILYPERMVVIESTSKYSSTDKAN